MRVAYKPAFVRQYSRLTPELQKEVLEKIEEFRDAKNHKKLKVHKLKGPLADFYSFSVNYRFRIVFEYLSKQETVLLAVGDHDIYK